jgi:cytochrome oxidase assembly protein ShyY1
MSASIPRHLVRLLPHLAALAVIVLCARLAIWQFDRAEYKAKLMAQWDHAEAVSLAAPQAAVDAPYLRVSTRGRFVAGRNVLLDNQVHRGQAGVHVYTPFRPDDSDRVWLVNRGWHALPSRSGPRPRVAAPDGEVEIAGRLVDPPRVGRQLGEAGPLSAERWPQLVTYLDIDRIREVMAPRVADQVILLDPEHPAHLTGEPWSPVVFGPTRHKAYAWQWVTMAVVVFLIWVFLTWRNRRPT